MDRRDAAVGVVGTATVGTPSAARIIKARSGGRRRSCNRCSSKKERCDGQEPCHRCMRSGWECLYATCRTLGRPRNSTLSTKRRAPTATALSKSSSLSSEAPSASLSAAKAATPGGASKRSVYRSSATTALPKASASSSRQAKPTMLTVADGLQANSLALAPAGQRRARARKCPARGSTSMVPASPNVLPLKRASFSPSPATGLVGMVQNRFLTCFLNDFGSLYDVLDDGTIRLGLINLMIGKVDEEAVGSVAGGFPTNAPSSPSTKRAAREGAAGSDLRSMVPKGESSAVAKTARASESSEGPQVSPLPPGVSQQEDYGINSAVFSAMALGALMLGQQPSEVEKYSAVAKASLRHCGALGVTVPNERVAVAQFLLGIASDIAGGSDYPECIRLARNCCENLDKRGRGCNSAMREALKYRRMIDALAKPSNTRVPAPADSAVDKSSPEGTSTELPSPMHASTPTAHAPGAEEGLHGQADDCTWEKRRRGADVEMGSWLGGTAERESNGECNKNDRGRRTSGDEDMQVASPLQRGNIVPDRGANGAVDGHCDPGLEAARMRSKKRQANCLSMVSDVMSVLSRIPWSLQSEDGARRTREELVELRSLLLVEKGLLEERRRFTRGSNPNESTPSSSLGSFALANAFIGLHCALEEFEDLLVLAREVATCISACPGLARYQVHGLHTALAILRAFGRRKEFADLVEATPIELRRLVSNNPIEFNTKEEMCSRHVCVMHCRAIRELGERYFGETSAAGGDDPETSSRSMTLSPSASTPTASGRELERGCGESVDGMFRGTEASPSFDGQRMEQDERRLNGTPEQLSPDKGVVKLERGENDGGAQRPPDNRSLNLEGDESQGRRLWSRPRRYMNGGQWTPVSVHMKQSSFSPSWVPSSQQSMGSAQSIPASIGNEAAVSLGCLSPPPFSGSYGGEYSVVSSSAMNEGERPLRQPTGALPPYSRLSSVCGSNGSDGVLPQMQLPDSVAPGSRHMMPFTEVLRQTHPSLRRAAGDWDEPHGDDHTRLSAVVGYAAGGRRNGTAAVAKTGGGPVEGSEVGCPLPSLRFAAATSGNGWASTGPRSLVGGASASLSASCGRGRIGLHEGCFEPMRDHFVGSSSSTGTDDTAQHVTGSHGQPSSLAKEGSNTRARGQSMEDQQDSPVVPLGGGTASPTVGSSPGSAVGEREEDVSQPPQLWDTVAQSGRVLASGSSNGTSEGFSHQQPVLPPSEALEGDAPFWQWGSPPREISSSASASSPSTIPGQPTECGHVASNGQLLQQASAPLSTPMSTPMSAAPSTGTYLKRRSSDSTGEWRSGDDRLLLSSSVTPPSTQHNAVGRSTAHAPSAVVAVSSSSSPPTVGGGTATSTGVPTGSSGSSGNRSAGNARVVSSVDGGGGHDDHMFMDLLELMDNGESQESAQ